MVAYKFLGPRRYSVLTGFRWPLGEWVATEGRLVPTLNGIHGCRPRHLPHWIGEELWTVELAGELLEGDRFVVAERGRLLERVGRWDDEALGEFGEACTVRSRDFGTAHPSEGWVPGAGAAYVAAHAAGVHAAVRGRSYETAFAEERAWQAAWLADRLGLTED